MNGIEFSNHDLIRNQKYRRRILAQVKKLKSYLGKRKYILLYHHRVCEGNNPDLLLRHLSELKTYYSTKEFECQIVLYKQTIISKEFKKELIYQMKNDIHIFDFHTYYSWSGRDQRKYWAYTDDSLIRNMLKRIKTF